MEFEKILEKAVNLQASDIFIVSGRPICLKINGRLILEDGDPLHPTDTNAFVQDIYQLAGQRDMEHLEATGDDDFAFAMVGLSRFRANIYKQRGSYAAIIRIIRFEIPNPTTLGIPSISLNWAT